MTENKRRNLAVMTSSARTGNGSDGWQTPEDVLVSVREFFNGTIDLDPFANQTNNTSAKRFITKEQNAFDHDWARFAQVERPSVWLNPPYSQMRQVISKLKEEVNRPKPIGEFLLLCRNSQGSQWFRDALTVTACYGVFRKRLKFKGASCSAPFDSVLLYGNGIWARDFALDFKSHLGFVVKSFDLFKEVQ